MTIILHEMNREQITQYVLGCIEQANDSIYPYVPYIAHLLDKKKNSDLKLFFSVPSTQISQDGYQNPFANLEEPLRSSALAYIQETTDNFSSDDLIYIYYGSSYSMFQNIFVDILPSDFHQLYTYMIENNILRKLGTNLGKAHLISSAIFSHDFSSFVAPHPFQNYSEAMKSMMKEFNYLKEDRSYLLSVLEQKDQFILSLQQKIQELQYQNYISSSHTWS